MVIVAPTTNRIQTIHVDDCEVLALGATVGAVVVEAIVLVVEDALPCDGTLDVVTTDCESTGTVVEDDVDVEAVDDGGVEVDVVEEVVVACGCTATVVVGASEVVDPMVVDGARVVVPTTDVVVTGAAIVNVAATY